MSSARVSRLRRARDEMIAVRAEIYGLVAGRSDVDLRRPPGSGGWSAVEVLDHLRTAEGLVVRALDRLEKGERPRVPTRAYFYRLPITPIFWSIPVPAPKKVQPRPLSALVPGEVVDGLKASRVELLRHVERMGEEAFAGMVLPHFLLGRFTGVTWLRFVGGHERKHAGQIRRVLSAVS